MKNLSNIYISAARKKDYITFMAVALLTLVILLEIIFVIWLPRKLSSETAWQREAVLEEVIELEDILRGALTSVKTKNNSLSGEISLAQKCLDDYAKFLRAQKATVSKEGIIDLYNDLKKFEKHFVFWKTGKTFVKSEKINPAEYFQKCLDDFNAREEKTKEYGDGKDEKTTPEKNN